MTTPTPRSDLPDAPPVGAVVGGVVSGGVFTLVADAPPATPLPLASLSARWMAYVIDNLLVVTAAVGALAVAHQSGVPGAGAGEGVWFGLAYAAWLFANILFIGYTAFLHGVTGQTIGKRLMGILVVRRDGSPLGMGRALLRTFGYFISSFLYAGFLMAFFGEDRRALHDYLADTVVVEIG